MDGACSPPRCCLWELGEMVRQLGCNQKKKSNESSPLASTPHQGCFKSPGLLSASGHQAPFLRAGSDLSLLQKDLWGPAAGGKKQHHGGVHP